MAKNRGSTEKGQAGNRKGGPLETAPWIRSCRKFIPLVIVLAALATYWNSFNGAFVFDDTSSIRDNPNIRQLWPLWKAATSAPNLAVAGRPIVSLSLAVNYAFCGLDARGYHALNLAIHVLLALLLFGIVRRTLSGEHHWNACVHQAPWLAGATALIWAVHPLTTESVTYIIQRTESLMGLFFLLTLYSVIRGAASDRPHKWWIVAVASCALGMGSKEVMVVAPLIVLLYDRIFLSRSFRDIFRARWILYVCLAATWILLGRLVLTGPRSATAGLRIGSLTPSEYFLTQFGVILHYLRLCIWPHPLCIDYFDWPITRTFASALPQIFFSAGLMAGALLWFQTQPWLSFLIAWFFLILAPTSSIVPIVTEVAAERRMYLPLMAIVLLAVLLGHTLIAKFPQGKATRAISFALLCGIAITLGVMTARRNEVYRSEVAILSDAVNQRPKNIRARNNLGSALAREGRIEEAIDQFNQVLATFPRYPEALNNLGAALYTKGRYKAAAALISDAVRLKPDYAEAHLNLGLALHSQGELKQAIVHYTEALRLVPGEAEVHNHLGVALLSLHQAQEAIAHFREALSLRPDYQEARKNLENVLSRDRPPQ
jgi:Flp pilus assembly protein TadD